MSSFAQANSGAVEEYSYLAVISKIITTFADNDQLIVLKDMFDVMIEPCPFDIQLVYNLAMKLWEHGDEIEADMLWHVLMNMKGVGLEWKNRYRQFKSWWLVIQAGKTDDLIKRQEMLVAAKDLDDTNDDAWFRLGLTYAFRYPSVKNGSSMYGCRFNYDEWRNISETLKVSARHANYCFERVLKNNPIGHVHAARFYRAWSLILLGHESRAIGHLLENKANRDDAEYLRVLQF